MSIKTDDGWIRNIIDLCVTGAPREDKIKLIKDYAEWTTECALEDCPNCDDCDERRGDEPRYNEGYL